MRCKLFTIRLLEGYNEDDISVLDNFLDTVKVSQIFSSVIDGDIPFWSVLVFYEDKLNEARHTVPVEEIILTLTEENLYEALRKWRNDQAAKENIPPYMVAHNYWLKQMAKMPVRSKEDLLGIKGFGEKRVEKYGDDILRVIEMYFHDRR